ncbi:MAG: NAD-dependent epimerase/dehydratase family protein, partial [Parvularculaceae bacterium]
MSLSLVTGGAGFVGRHLVRKLRARGEVVRVLDIALAENAGDVEGSVADEGAAAEAVRDVATVFHLAGNAQLWARNNKVFDEANRRGTEVMVAAAKRAGVKRFIHCSSLTTLVGRRTPLGPSTADETVMLDPRDMLGPYPRSKLLAERAVEAAVGEGLDAVIAIPTEPLGPGDQSLTPPTRMILDFASGRTPAYIDCTLNFVPVDSLADGFIAARDRGRRGQRYLLGGDNISMETLLQAIERLTGKPMPKRRLPYAIAELAGVIDTGILARLTGKPPKAPLTGVRLAGR